MSIMIHYKGSLNKSNLIEIAISDLIDISTKMGFEYTEIDEDLTKPNTSFLDNTNDNITIKGHLAIKGISIDLHNECEGLSIFFDKNGCLRDPALFALNNGNNDLDDETYIAVKTQYSSPEIHIIIISILKFLKSKYIQNLTVIDEGEYWETGNKKILEEKFKFLSSKINETYEILSNTKKGYEDEIPILLVQKIEDLLKEKLEIIK